MAKPMTRILPAVGIFRYDSDTPVKAVDQVAGVLSTRGDISVTYTEPSRKGSAQKTVTSKYSFKKNVWSRAVEHEDFLVVAALTAGCEWFNEGSRALISAHSQISKGALPYIYTRYKPKPARAADTRATWRRLETWMAPANEENAPISDTRSGVSGFFDSVAESLSSLNRPFPMRLSLLDDAFDGAVVLHLLVPESTEQEQIYLCRDGHGLQIDASRGVDAKTHHAQICMSNALAAAAGFGMFLSDPQARITVVLESGDPAKDFPAEAEVQIDIGGGGLMDTLHAIEGTAIDALRAIPGLSVSGTVQGALNWSGRSG